MIRIREKDPGIKRVCATVFFIHRLESLGHTR